LEILLLLLLLLGHLDVVIDVGELGWLTLAKEGVHTIVAAEGIRTMQTGKIII
jgi:hypothetical protein